MPNAYNQAILEQYIIGCIFERPHYISRVKEYFLSEISQQFAQTIENLLKDKKEINIGTIVLESSKFTSNLTKEKLITITENHEYNVEDFDDYVKNLKSNFLQDQLRTENVRELVLAVEEKDNFDIEKVSGLLHKASKRVEEIKTGKVNVFTLTQSMNRMKDTVNKRTAGLGNLSSGSSPLDKALGNGFNTGELVLIYGRPSMGKSAFKKYLQNGMINRFIPSISFDLEMSEQMETQRLIAMRTGIPFHDFYNKERDLDKAEYLNYIIDQEATRLEKYVHFREVDESSLSIDRMEYYIETFKKETGYDHINVMVDLASMISDFKENSNQATAIQYAIDKLSGLAKSGEDAIIGLVQSNRSTLNGKRVTSIDQVNDLRPQLEHLKGSGGWEERARVVIGLHRPKYYVERYIPERVSLTENIIEAQILKNTNGATGQILKYLFQEKNFRMYPYEEPENLDEAIDEEKTTEEKL